MDVLLASELLGLWERAAPLAPLQQAVVLAAATDSSAHPTDVAVLPIGQRDRRLLRLRASMAGPMLEATTTCASCGERVELSLDTTGLVEPPVTSMGPYTTDVEGVSVTWRSPTTADLEHIASLADLATADEALFERCVLSVGGAGPMTAAELSPEVRAAVTAAMSEVDPLAELLVDMTCVHCAEQFTAELDVAEATWAELRACAHRVLHEVDALARAYGWTEDEVLALSEWRRAAYLELATVPR